MSDHPPNCGHDHAPVERTGWFPHPSDCTLVLLAAGASSRMGDVKAALPLRSPWGVPEGETAIARILRLSAPLGRKIVVLGHHAEVVRAAAGPAEFARNPVPDEGMFSSVCAGLRMALQLQKPPAAVLVWPVDVPLVSIRSVRALFAAGHSGDTPDRPWVRLLAADRQGAPSGHPVLLSRGLAQLALETQAPQRLDLLLAGAGVIRTTVKVPDPYVGIDLDTYADAAPYLKK
jgi:molybdenum cofactor cytidylyltransferase